MSRINKQFVADLRKAVQSASTQAEREEALLRGVFGQMRLVIETLKTARAKDPSAFDVDELFETADEHIAFLEGSVDLMVKDLAG